MLDRESTILSAAKQVFLRYGVKRATMNDIAAEAGVARQTLYNAFANKEAILRGIIDGFIEETCSSISQHIEQGGSLEDGLELAFDHFARQPYQIIHMTAHGAEIMEAMEEAAEQEMANSKQRFSEAINLLLKAHSSEVIDKGIDESTIADFIVHSAMGHKAKASSEEHLNQLLGTLKKLVLK